MCHCRRRPFLQPISRETLEALWDCVAEVSPLFYLSLFYSSYIHLNWTFCDFFSPPSSCSSRGFFSEIAGKRRNQSSRQDRDKGSRPPTRRKG